MGLTIDWVALDCADAPALARFWAEALGYRIVEDDDPDERLVVPSNGPGPRLLFLRVPDDKIVKNRLHLDLCPDDQAAEVDRLIKLGAKRVDIGQGDVSWVVLADPEGNEFCVLRTLNEQDRAEREAKGIT
jgi:catechol 2,3-dioxygenase-like lactoylglutathione lyase family enzyme